jgi:serine/threonine protein kinase
MTTLTQPEALVSIGLYTTSPSQRLGSGAFSEVYKGTHSQSKAQVAIKCILRSNLTPKLNSHLESEITVMRTLEHENVVRLLDVVKTDNHIYLIMEYCNSNDLAHYLKRNGAIPDARARSFVKQLVLGIQHGRLFHLLHRDLKPQNLLLHKNSEGQFVLKIADFGFAKFTDKETDLAETLCGSPLYMAPEILRYQPYDAKGDLWSLGVIIYEMVTGRPPFTALNHVDLLKKIQTTPLTFPSPNTLPTDCVDLLRKLLVVDPKQRMSYEELFAHPYCGLEVESIRTIPQAPQMIPVYFKLMEVSNMGEIPSNFTFNELSDYIAKKFGFTSPFKIQYLDEDKDWINLTRQAEMEMCFQSGSKNQGIIVLNLVLDAEASCPVCSKKFNLKVLERHVNTCLASASPTTTATCPVCKTPIAGGAEDQKAHIDICLGKRLTTQGLAHSVYVDVQGILAGRHPPSTQSVPVSPPPAQSSAKAEAAKAEAAKSADTKAEDTTKPKVETYFIYCTRPVEQTTVHKNAQRKIIGLLGKAGVELEKIQLISVDSPALHRHLNTIADGVIQLPHLFREEVRIGTLAEIEAASDPLAFVRGSSEPSDDLVVVQPPPPAGRVLEGSHVISAAVWLQQQDEEPQAAQLSEKTEETSAVEVDVWRINWLWRSNHRRLRFDADSFKRLTEDGKYVRMSYPYDQVEKIDINTDYLIISFISSTIDKPMYLDVKVLSDANVQLICDQILQRNGLVPIVDVRPKIVAAASSAS